MSKYTFGTRTAEFHVCSRCGVVPLVTSLVGDRLYAVVSVNAFENVESSLIHRAPADFDTESTESRLARRVKNWIGQVAYTSGGL